MGSYCSELHEIGKYEWLFVIRDVEEKGDKEETELSIISSSFEEFHSYKAKKGIGNEEMEVSGRGTSNELNQDHASANEHITLSNSISPNLFSFGHTYLDQ